MLPLMRSRSSSADSSGRAVRSALTWLGCRGDLVEHADGRADLARRAVAALVAVVLDEGRLHRVQRCGVPRPSMVVTLAPSCITASVRQELMRWPSTITVQAPHWPWSQPFLVPVRCRCSRSASSSVVRVSRSSVCAWPLTTEDKNQKEKRQIQTRTRHGESLWFSGIWIWYSSSPPLVDAPRSAGPDGSGIALSERSAA
jgi:hypothetical protein